MRPFISIITPCRNSAKTIERTIKSVLQQDYKNYEYIIVDGASTDCTVDIIKKYEPQFEGRLKWRSEPDKGVYDGFNKGCKLAQGVFTWIVNSDDWIEPKALISIRKSLREDKNQNSILVGRMNIVDIDGKKASVTPLLTQKLISKAFSNDSMINHPATIVPKCIYEQYGYYDDRFYISADMDWFHRVYAKGVRFITTDSILTNFSLGGVSTQYIYKKSLHDKLIFLRNKYGKSPFFVVALIRWHIRYFRFKWFS